MGGRDVTLGRLTELFENSESEPVGIMPQKYYWHGNEPDLHYAYIFSALDQPAGSARWSRWIRTSATATTPPACPATTTPAP
jgi:putative alpha-1,2-mannosidase